MVDPNGTQIDFMPVLPPALIGGPYAPTGNYLTGSQAGTINTAFVGVGDSWTAGNNASPLTDGFTFLASAWVNTLFPTIGLVNLGYVGCTAYDYESQDLAINITNIPLYGAGTPQFATIFFGNNEMRTPNSVSEPGSCEFASLADATTYSYAYKGYLQIIISAYRVAWPNLKIILPTICDLSTLGGGGDTSLDPGMWADYTGALAQYNARVVELAQANNCALADFYAAMYGHPEYYGAGYHPNTLGHAILAAVIEGILPSLAGGDTMGTYPNTKVIGIDGIQISGLPTNGQVYTYNSSTNTWDPTTITGGLSPGTVGQILMTTSGPVVAWETPGGDVSVGATGLFTINGISGIPITGTPTPGQILEYNGSAWIPTTPSSTGVTSVTASSPVVSSGTSTPNISLINGTNIGDVLTWNGSAWVDGPQSGGTNAQKEIWESSGTLVYDTDGTLAMEV
jgi:hypothetical protein